MKSTRTVRASYIATGVAVAVVPVIQFLAYLPLSRVVNCFPELAFTRSMAQWAVVFFVVSMLAWIAAHILHGGASPREQPIHGGHWFFVTWAAIAVLSASVIAIGLADVDPVAAACGNTYLRALAQCSVLLAPTLTAFAISFIIRRPRPRASARIVLSVGTVVLGAGLVAVGLGLFPIL